MMMNREQENLNDRISWILWFRFAFLGVILSSSFFFDLGLGSSFSSNLYLVTFGGLSLTGLSGIFLSRIWIQERNLAWAQIVIDLAISTFLVWITGGVNSAFTLLFGLNVLAAGILMLSQGALAATLGSVLCMLTMGVAGTWGWLDVDDQSLIQTILLSSALLLVGSIITLLFRNREQMAKTLYRTSRNLEDLSQIHSAIVSHMPSGVLLTDSSGFVLYANESASRLLGETVEFQVQVLGRAEVEMNGHVMIAETVDLPENRRLVLLTDISEIRSLESSVRLKEKLASVGQLAAGLAHEIKNPLASLSGSIQLLKSELSQDASEGKLMKIVLRETDRLDELLTNFLCYAKPAQLTLTVVKYRELVSDILSLLQNSLEEEAKNRILFKNELTDKDQSLADEGKLKQVFWNLLKNAVSAIDKEKRGEVTVRAHRSTREGVEFLKISIQDSGVGIHADDIGRIFEPFFTRKAQGTGLGLAVVYQSIQAHRGQIGVNSQVGKGSEFWFEVPVKGPHGLEQNARSAA